MKRALFFVFWLGISYLTYSQNLLMNPGLESWDKVTKPSGWTHIENCLKDSVSVRSGSYSCKHTGGATAASDLGQTVTVSPGKTYAISFFYRTTISGSGNGSRLWSYWKDAGGNNITDPASDLFLRPSKYLKSDTWEQFSLTITAPALASFFYLEVRTYPNSVTYWDGFVIEETNATKSADIFNSQPQIYPNPASTTLTIRQIDNLQFIHIQTMEGKTIWSSEFSGENSVTIPVSGFPDGLYIIRISASGKTIIRKFIKN